MLNFMIISLSATNCFLIYTPKGYLLVDCGYLHNQKIFRIHLRKLGVSFTDIKYLMLTHHHRDHCGLVHFLKKANPAIKAIMSEKCAQYLQKGDYGISANSRYANPRLGRIISLYTRLGKFTAEPEPYFAADNDIIIRNDDYAFPQESGLDGRIILTPGHTDDSISLIVGEHAFIGDAARNMLNFTGAPYRPILAEDLEECYASWEKLKTSAARILYPSHGSPFAIEKLPITKSGVE